MEAADISTMIERCTPPVLARPVAAILRQASAFEPLLVTIAGKRPIRILAESKPEAIMLASEAVAGGQVVRVGLAQLDSRDLKDAGLTMTAAFDPCTHIGAVGRAFENRKAKSLGRGVGAAPAAEQAIASFKVDQTEKPSPSPAAKLGTETGSSEPESRQEGIASAKDPPSWNVYGARRGASLLIYSR